jgi:hypothetical protein
VYRRIYAALAVLALVPIWSVHYLPTQDGPSHLYNSWVLHELVRGAGGAIATWYRVDWRPHPNWLGSAVMALLMTIVPPVIAEKLFVSAIIALFLAGVWMYTAEEARPYAIMAVPFAYHSLLLAGFYNFSAGVGLYFVTVALWWRRRTRPDWRTITLIAMLLVLGYFMHPLPLLLAMMTLVLLGVATRASAKHLLALLPVLPLLIWYARTSRGQWRPLHATASEIVSYITWTQTLVTVGEAQEWLGGGLFVMLIALMIATIVCRQRSESNVFLLPLLATIVLYTFSPGEFAGGLAIQERIALFIPLIPLAWIAPCWRQQVTRAIAVALTVAAIADIGYICIRFRESDREMVRLVDSAGALGSDATVKAFAGGHLKFLHTISYALIARRDIDLRNYEAISGYFPTALREAGNACPEYVFTWDIPLPAELGSDYRLVSQKGSGSIWRRP